MFLVTRSLCLIWTLNRRISENKKKKTKKNKKTWTKREKKERKKERKWSRKDNKLTESVTRKSIVSVDTKVIRSRGLKDFNFDNDQDEYRRLIKQISPVSSRAKAFNCIPPLIYLSLIPDWWNRINQIRITFDWFTESKTWLKGVDVCTAWERRQDVGSSILFDMQIKTTDHSSNGFPSTCSFFLWE